MDETVNGTEIFLRNIILKKKKKLNFFKNANIFEKRNRKNTSKNFYKKQKEKKEEKKLNFFRLTNIFEKRFRVDSSNDCSSSQKE